jgi:hypothetical protein
MIRVKQLTTGYGEKLTVAHQKALFQITEDIKRAAQMKAPVDTGELRATAQHVIKNVNQHTIIFPKIYASIQETRDDFKHPKGGQSRYLQSSVNALAPSFPDYVKRYK